MYKKLKRMALQRNTRYGSVSLMYDKPSGTLRILVLPVYEHLLDDLDTGACRDPGFMVLLDIFKLQIERVLDILEMVILKAYREDPVISDRFSLKVELQERMGLLVVFDLKSVGKLVELGVSARQRLVTEHSQDGMPELRARPPENMNFIVIREADLKITFCNDRP